MKKKLFIIIPLVIVLILGITFAMWSAFTSSNIDVVFNVDGIIVTYNGGPDISGIKLIPVSSKEKGETDGTGIAKIITASADSTLYMDLNLNLEIFPNGLKHESLVWEIYEGNTLINSGNFANANQGDTVKLFEGQEINSTTSTYKLYIWIDGLQSNPESIDNQSFKFVLNANATEESPSVIASDKIIELAGNCTSWESGFSGVCATSAYDDNGVTKYHEYRYVGENVNNWVRVNDDDYRIIGVFDDNSHGITGEYLVKLIGDRKLFASAWGAYNDTTNYTTYSGYNNNWLTGNLNILLNTYYMNPNDTSPYGTCENLTYYYNTDGYKTKDCSKIKRYGIQSQELRNYIQPVTWYLKGYSSNAYSKQNFYTCERSDNTTISNCNKSSATGAVTKVENTNIGLMYVSDYLYASGYYSSSDTTSADSYYYGNQNWLYNGLEWTITPRGSKSTATTSFYVRSYGSVSYSDGYASIGYGSRPSFYLNSNIRITSGDGSFGNPYIIG